MPQITDLKSKRIEFKRIQTINDSKKVRYDKLSSKLASERHHLERECDRLQSEWKQSERNYHYLANVNEIARVNLEKIEMEENWKNGDDKMLPDFKCLHDLYEHKLVQQENLAKQLRIEQRLIKENEPENMKQVSRKGLDKQIVKSVTSLCLCKGITNHPSFTLLIAANVFVLAKAHAAQGGVKERRDHRSVFFIRKREWKRFVCGL